MNGYQKKAQYHPFEEVLGQIQNDWAASGGVAQSEFNFILCGQSNSVGRIDNLDPTKPADLPTNGVIANANYFDDDNTWKPYGLQMNYYPDHVGDYGIEYRIAKYMTDKGITVNLLKYGWGGQAVTGGQWAENATLPIGLINAIKASGKQYTLMIWIQGESDSVDLVTANQYEVNARATHEKIRTESGQNFKIAFNRICLPVETTGLPNIGEVNTALEALSIAMPNAVYVNTPDVINATDIAYNQHYNGLGLDKIALKNIETLGL